MDELLNFLEFSTKIEQLGVKVSDYESKLDILTKNALENPATKFNSIVPNESEAEAIFRTLL